MLNWILLQSVTQVTRKLLTICLHCKGSIVLRLPRPMLPTQGLWAPLETVKYKPIVTGPMVDLGATEISIQTIENQKSKPKAIIDMDSNDFEIGEWLSDQYNNYCYRKKSFQNLTWWPYIEGKTISISRDLTLAESHSHAKGFHCGDGDLLIFISSEGRAKLISVYRKTSTCETAKRLRLVEDLNKIWKVLIKIAIWPAYKKDSWILDDAVEGASEYDKEKFFEKQADKVEELLVEYNIPPDVKRFLRRLNNEDAII